MAKTKQTERPFSFWEKEVARAQQQKLEMELGAEVTDHMEYQFRAQIVPWQVRVEKFKLMMSKDEYEREQRIKKNAERNYKMASLPPRMQAAQDKRRQDAEDNLDSTVDEATESQLFDFRPPRARSVPDFRKI